MASFNVTIEDHSPLITYAPAGAWSDTPANDTLAQAYSGGSFHTTSAQDASATIQFNGTGISVFGGKRPNYGKFRFTVDGQTIEEGSAASSSSETKQLLGQASRLSDGAHTAVLTYTGGGSAIDIDSVVLDDQVGNGSLTVTRRTFDDTDPKVIYEPASAWNTNSRPEFINNTLHFTSSSDAKASLTFFGDALAVYGTVAPDHADIQVTLDGLTRTLKGGAGGLVRTLRTQTLLYYASNLGTTEHQLVLQAAPTENAPFMDLDAITVYSAVRTNSDNRVGAGSPIIEQSSAEPSATNTPPSGTADAQNAQKSSSLSKRTIIAASVGGAVGFVLLLVLAFLLFRWKRRQRSNYPPDDLSPKSPQLPIQRPRMSENGFQRWSFQTPFVPSTQSRVTSVASSYESTAPMLNDVPIIKPPSPARMSNLRPELIRPPRSYTPASTPTRPPRPPTLNYDYWDGGPMRDPSRAV